MRVVIDFNYPKYLPEADVYGSWNNWVNSVPIQDCKWFCNEYFFVIDIPYSTIINTISYKVRIFDGLEIQWILDPTVPTITTTNGQQNNIIQIDFGDALSNEGKCAKCSKKWNYYTSCGNMCRCCLAAAGRDENFIDCFNCPFGQSCVTCAQKGLFIVSRYSITK